jgi:hypothetical protein
LGCYAVEEEKKIKAWGRGSACVHEEEKKRRKEKEKGKEIRWSVTCVFEKVRKKIRLLVPSNHMMTRGSGVRFPFISMLHLL